MKKRQAEGKYHSRQRSNPCKLQSGDGSKGNNTDSNWSPIEFFNNRLTIKQVVAIELMILVRCNAKSTTKTAERNWLSTFNWEFQGKITKISERFVSFRRHSHVRPERIKEFNLIRLEKGKNGVKINDFESKKKNRKWSCLLCDVQTQRTTRTSRRVSLRKMARFEFSIFRNWICGSATNYLDTFPK